MQLPRAREAIIDPRKLTHYLLSLTHPVGKHKARVFRALGFSEGNTALLEQRIRTIAENDEVDEEIPAAHGTKYTVIGTLDGAAGGSVRIRTVWMVDAPELPPRFVTAYPCDD